LIKMTLAVLMNAVVCNRSPTAKKSLDDKKTIKKALIPLPPTGFASLYCAKAGVAQVKVAPKPAEQLVAHFAISRCARFCKKVQWLCVSSRASQVGGRSAEPPIYKGVTLENKRLIEFSNSQKFVSGAL
jgi:hypothetical protein